MYTGRERDAETGLQLNRNRYYHQQLGRWVSRDPIGYEAESENLYEYVHSNPAIFVDPAGLEKEYFEGKFGGFHGGFKRYFPDYVTYKGEFDWDCIDGKATVGSPKITSSNVFFQPDTMSVAFIVGFAGTEGARIANVNHTSVECPDGCKGGVKGTKQILEFDVEHYFESYFIIGFGIGNIGIGADFPGLGNDRVIAVHHYKYRINCCDGVKSVWRDKGEKFIGPSK